MAASPELHRMGLLFWITTLTVREPVDWTRALTFSHSVRELNCLDGALTTDYQKVLSRFPKLIAVSIDSHGDVKSNAGRFAYCDVFSSLPGSLRRLEIRHAHGPDINVISTVKKYCPNLQELWLGRCTMFNRTPACHFWETFPFDHNSYISDEGTDAYAYSLGQELAPLLGLETLRLGVYLTPFSVVLAHRAFHSQSLPAPDVVDWQQAVPAGDGNAEPPQNAIQVQNLVSLLHQRSVLEESFSVDSCLFCQEQYYVATSAAEESASAILKASIPSLHRVEWMGWFTPQHLRTTCLFP
ncbi:hypothetical protein FRC12_019309 [Ceratobasidium sp. 428]|nr:hypothetical protein FRC12_019309 [Ceratobasidium sp. 428]